MTLIPAVTHRLRAVLDTSLRAKRMDVGLLVLRATPALMLAILHGGKKIAHFDAESVAFADPLGIGHLPSLLLALGAEVGCSLAIALGLFTRLAALPVVFTLMMVFVVRSGGDAEADPQLASVYAAAFVAVAIMGPGGYSLDAWIEKRLATRAES